MGCRSSPFDPALRKKKKQEGDGLTDLVPNWAMESPATSKRELAGD